VPRRQSDNQVAIVQRPAGKKYDETTIWLLHESVDVALDPALDRGGRDVAARPGAARRADRSAAVSAINRCAALLRGAQQTLHDRMLLLAELQEYPAWKSHGVPPCRHRRYPDPNGF
jgi:hypothetical protein